MKFNVRAADLFITGGRKIAELKEVTFSIKGNGERFATSAGVGKSKGRPFTDVDFEAVVPVNGMSFDVFKATINQTSLSVGVPFNGANYAVDGSFDEATFKSIQQSGMSTGTFKFTGGEPTVS